MKISYYFLHQVYNHYHDYYQLEREQKHHILIHVMILVMVICALLPMVISIVHGISFKAVAYPTSITVLFLLFWGRKAYKNGKLNKYKEMY